MKERMSEALYAFLMFVLVLVVFGLAFCASGCRSTEALPTPEVPIDVVEKKIPVPCVTIIEPLPDDALLPLASAESLREWASKNDMFVTEQIRRESTDSTI